MLRSLKISNYAIINEAEIEFSPSMNVITGETGAGKSILLGALGLVLGERSDSKVLYNRERKCIVEAVFEIRNYGLDLFFEENDIDFDEETVIRRELNENGKSRAFINDTPVNLNILQQLADRLITIHSQHETLALGNSAFQMTVIDSLAGHNELLISYRKSYTAWKECERSLRQAQELFTKANSEKDFISFQYDELSKIPLDDIRQDELENELQQLLHAEEIKSGLIQSAELLENGTHAATGLIREVLTLLRNLSKYDQSLLPYTERLESSLAEIKDIARDFVDREERIVAEPGRVEEIQSTLNILFRMQKKHGLSTVEELIELRDKLQQTLNSFENSREEIEKLSRQKEKLFSELLAHSKKISAGRASVFSNLETTIKSLLSEVGMKDAELKIAHEYDPEKYLGVDGADSIRFLFSANKGSAPQDISRVASGGELSRLMLCIKSLLAESVALPTLIFDEIDSGISGETANKVGRILSDLAKNHQLITITHLPQIASKGDHHLYVYKESNAKSTFTRIKPLNKSERIEEVAKMLSGANPTKAAVETAKELLSHE